MSKIDDNLITVSIVEDDTRIREGLAVLLNGSDEFRCLGSFPNAETALEVFKSVPGLRDAIRPSEIKLVRAMAVGEERPDSEMIQRYVQAMAYRLSIWPGLSWP